MPKKYITAATNSTKTSGASCCNIPANVQNPDPINPKNKFKGYTLKLVNAIPIRHNVVPNHFTSSRLCCSGILYMLLSLFLKLLL